MKRPDLNIPHIQCITVYIPPAPLLLPHNINSCHCLSCPFCMLGDSFVHCFIALFGAVFTFLPCSLVSICCIVVLFVRETHTI